jgi:hypothetical protein
MATTTNYGWTTPNDTDLVKDGAAAIRTLGSSIDTTVFANASAGIPKTIVDAKGDIIAATAADTVSRLAIGTNGQVLTADSAEATGMKWGTVAAGGMTLISSTTLTGSSVTLSSIPSAYKNLQIVIQSYRPATGNELMRLRINGDSTASRHAEFPWGSSNSSDNAFNLNYIPLTGEGTSGTSNSFYSFMINDYANTTTWKSITGYGIVNNNAIPTKFNYNTVNGFYNQTAAVSSLMFFPVVGNFTSGTILLYGVS